jgi:CRP/FNR family transcriptional regulator, anaerobic regulatory protein
MTAGSYARLPCSRCVARTSTLCASLADDDMHRLYGLATELQFEEGGMLLRQELPADYVFSIRSGHATIFRLTADGKRQILAFLFPGDFVGFTSEDRYHYGVNAISTVEACRFERTALEALIEAFPQMDRKLRFTLTRAMDASFELLFSLGRKDALQKVASFLWYVSYRQRKLGQPDNPVHLPMRRADIADFMGLTTETVSRTLKTLKDMGAIRLQGAYDVDVTDMGRLRSIGVVVAEPAPYLHADPDYYPHKDQ